LINNIVFIYIFDKSEIIYPYSRQLFSLKGFIANTLPSNDYVWLLFFFYSYCTYKAISATSLCIDISIPQAYLSATMLIAASFHACLADLQSILEDSSQAAKPFGLANLNANDSASATVLMTTDKSPLR
jgi:hypothetical protein